MFSITAQKLGNESMSGSKNRKLDLSKNEKKWRLATRCDTRMEKKAVADDGKT